MDVFRELFSRENFPLGTTIMICEGDSYCVAIPRSHDGVILEYDEDPLVAAEKALARLTELRKIKRA